MTEKDILTAAMQREFATTLRVIQAFPQSELHFKPHDRSRDARSLLEGFVREMHIMESAVKMQIDMDRIRQYEAKDLMQISDDFESATAEFLSLLGKTEEQELNKHVQFFGRELRAMDVLWGLLFDQIHHRGQMSVYIRMAGGKVPSIYGPSADEQPGM